MSAFENVSIPFVTMGNRQVLTGMQLVEHPWLREFVDRFPNCFAPDNYRDILVFYPDGDAPKE